MSDLIFDQQPLRLIPDPTVVDQSRRHHAIRFQSQCSHPKMRMDRRRTRNQSAEVRSCWLLPVLDIADFDLS